MKAPLSQILDSEGKEGLLSLKKTPHFFPFTLPRRNLRLPLQIFFLTTGLPGTSNCNQKPLHFVFLLDSNTIFFATGNPHQILLFAANWSRKKTEFLVCNL